MTLSYRQRQVLAILASRPGAMNRDIGLALGIAEATAGAYVRQLLDIARLPHGKKTRVNLAGMAGRLLGGVE